MVKICTIISFFGMQSISFKYNYKKIIGFIIFGITMLGFFCYTLLNGEYLSQKKLSSSARHRWVGELFYENKNLLILFSIILILLSLYLTISLSIKLFNKEMIISLIEKKLYVNGNYIACIDNIKKLHLVTSKNNSSIYVYLKRPDDKYIENKNLLKKIKRRTFLIFNRNIPIINISLIQTKSSEAYLTIKKFLNLRP